MVKEMRYKNRIAELRKMHGISQHDLASEISIALSTLQNYEYGKRDIPGDVAVKLCGYFGCSANYLLCVDDDDQRSKQRYFTDVPLYGSIAAGKPLEMSDIEDSMPIPSAMHNRYPDAFLLKVAGTSMDRILPNGCYALVDPCDTVEHDGRPYAVCVNGYDATIKRVRKLANGFMLVPDSNDPTYKPQVYDYGVPDTETITIIGEIVYYILPYEWAF